MELSLEPHISSVAEHYEEHVIDYEKIRLEHDSPVEFALTLRLLDQWVSKGAVVVDVGVGVGHYATHLAQRACLLHLVDICESFLKLTSEKLQQTNLTSRLLSSHRASATHLSFLEDESVDCVLMLGPFYHLTEGEDRQRAAKEAHRVLKKGGVFFASGINRIALLRELFGKERFFGEERVCIETLEGELEHFCATGISNKALFPPLGDAYCCTAEELQTLFAPHFTQVELLGLESFSAFHQKRLFDYTPSEISLWLSLLEKSARTHEGVGASEHILYVGKKGAF
ncbi:MAG: 2-methoxy-6-polyprenyl-1,4-benzoquinol methylase, mitochondrial [Chlamydiia bacterium]|nr:2-methoxy-6-polyprenyl-1,4-benzoquinol methylase, mitochondrial [Chlamydiia bacterium]